MYSIHEKVVKYLQLLLGLGGGGGGGFGRGSLEFSMKSIWTNMLKVNVFKMRDEQKDCERLAVILDASQAALK